MASGTSSASTSVAISGPAATSRSVDRLGARELVARVVLEVAQHDAAHALDDAQEAGARPVGRRVAHDQPRSGHEHAGGDRRRPPTTGRPGSTISSSVSSSQLATVTWRPERCTDDAGRGQHALGVVAAERRLADRRGAVGGQAGQQHARLDLRAGHRQVVGDRAQARAGDRERRQAVAGRLHGGAHAAQRLGDAVDGAPADRRVAVEREAAALLPGQPARQQPHERARVADVDRAARLPGLAQAGAADDDLVGAQLDQRTERAGWPAASRWCRRRRGSCGCAPARPPSHPAAPPGARSTCRPAASARRAGARPARSGRSCRPRGGVGP